MTFFQCLPQILSRVALRPGGHGFGRSGGHDAPPVLAAFGAQVNNIVANLDDFKVVLDDDDRVPEPDEFAEELEELADIVEMEAGRRLVEKIEGPARRPPAQLLGQLDPLSLSARKRRRRLAQADVPETDAFERRQTSV